MVLPSGFFVYIDILIYFCNCTIVISELLCYIAAFSQVLHAKYSFQILKKYIWSI